MITAAAFTAFGFSGTVLLLASLLFVLSFRWRALRRPATRMLVMFGIFALASGYIWLDLGPTTDLRLQASEHPHIHHAPPLLRDA